MPDNSSIGAIQQGLEPLATGLKQTANEARGQITGKYPNTPPPPKPTLQEKDIDLKLEKARAEDDKFKVNKLTNLRQLLARFKRNSHDDAQNLGILKPQSQEQPEEKEELKSSIDRHKPQEEETPQKGVSRKMGRNRLSPPIALTRAKKKIESGSRDAAG